MEARMDSKIARSCFSYDRDLMLHGGIGGIRSLSYDGLLPSFLRLVTFRARDAVNFVLLYGMVQYMRDMVACYLSARSAGISGGRK